MIQVWMTGARADAHRQDLLTSAQTHRRGRRGGAGNGQAPATRRSASGFPVGGGRAVSRALAPKLGAWLISAGTKLGGASMRTS